MQVTVIQRQYLYFKSGSETLFGWVHRSKNCEASDMAAVICNPLGVEYMSGHRSIRHLADQLANSGIPTLRFDYSFNGDSTGGRFQDFTVSQIMDDIRSAADAVRSETGAPRIALIGIGLGATFAAMAANQFDTHQLVLWNPTVKGSRFIREQRLLSDVLDQSQDTDSDAIDSAGLYMTAELQQSFSSIDLAQLAWQGKTPVLLISKKNAGSHRKLIDTLSKKNLPFEHAILPGYEEMVDRPTRTIVPVHAIEVICKWIVKAKSVDCRSDAATVMTVTTCKQAQFDGDDAASNTLTEIPAMFGAKDHLFGIATLPDGSTKEQSRNRAFVFLNCGVEHQTGPHRMYARLCRRLASQGEFTFRFDIEGIGDSVSIGGNKENTPYSPTALGDIDLALRYLRERYGCDEFILSGICAGAFHAFRSATEFTQHNIREINLINPLVFEWNYDDPEDYHRYEVHTYKSAVLDYQRWRRLFSGDINYRRLLSSLGKHMVEISRRYFGLLVQAITGKVPKGLPSNLRTLRELDRRLTLILSEGDPGLDIMKLQARRETRDGRRNSTITVHRLAKSNHGLSKKYMQDSLVSFIVNKYSTENDDGT